MARARINAIVASRLHDSLAGKEQRRHGANSVGLFAPFTIRMTTEIIMAGPKPIDYGRASPRVRAVFDDIKRVRNVEDVSNFWKYLAAEPALLERTWASVKEVMSAGALSPLVKEMIYVAVSVTNGCAYCIASHSAGARKAGMTEEMFGELMAVVGMANETNRLAHGYRVPIDAAFES
jgi:AhpD family alkylhydroperoxidase